MAAWVAFLGEASDIYLIGEMFCGLKPLTTARCRSWQLCH